MCSPCAQGQAHHTFVAVGTRATAAACHVPLRDKALEFLRPKLVHFANRGDRALLFLATRHLDRHRCHVQRIVAGLYQLGGKVTFLAAASAAQPHQQRFPQLGFATLLDVGDSRQGAAGNLLAGKRLDLAQLPLLVGRHQRNGDASLAGAPRATYAVHVRLRVRRQIIVEDVGDIVDVQAACGHIRGHQDGVLAAAETLQRLLAALLAQVATQRLGRETGRSIHWPVRPCRRVCARRSRGGGECA